MSSGEVGRLSVTVTADTSPMERKIRADANDIGDRHGRSFGQKFGMAAGIGVGAIAGGVGIAAAGVGALTAGMFKMAQAGQESVQVGQTTAAIIKSTGAASWTSAAQVDTLATALSNKTGVDDEAIATGANLLLTFKQVQNQAGKGAAIFDRATTAAVDLSKAGFGSIDSASKMLGKALNDPVKGVTALSRAGVTFTDQQKEQIKTLVESGKTLEAQKVIMKEVESQVGGVAEATKSPIEALQTVFGNLQEGIGKALLPAVQKVADLLIPVLDDLQGPLAAVAGTIGTALVGALEAAAPLLGPLSQLFGQVAQVLAGVLTSALNALMPVFEALLPVLGQIATAFGEGLMQVVEALAPSLPVLAQAIAEIALAIMPIIPLAADLLVAFAPLVEVVAELAAEMAPLLAQFIKGAVDSGVLQAAIGLISGAVLILVPLIRDMGQKWIVVQGILTKVWDAIFKAVKPVMDWITGTAVPWMKEFADTISKKFTATKVTAEQVWQAIGDAIKKFVTWFGGVVQSVKDVLTKIGAAWEGAKRKVAEVWDGIILYLAGIVDTFVGIGGDIVEGLKRGISEAWGNLTGWFTDKVGGLIDGAKGVLGIASPSKAFIKIGGNVVDGFRIGLSGMDKVNADTARKMDAAVKASESRLNTWLTVQKQAVVDAKALWAGYRDAAASAILGGIDLGAAMQAAESEGIPLEEAFRRQLEESNLFGTALQQVSAAITAQFGPNSPGGQALIAQMQGLGPVAGIALGKQLVGSDGAATGLLGTIVNGLTAQNVWAGKVASSMADNAHGSGVAQAEAALLGIEKQVRKERERLEAAGAAMGDGLVVGFAGKEGAFKAAVRSFIRATEQELGINSPSRVFAEIGAFTAEGFNRGWDGAIASPQFAAPAMPAFSAGDLSRVYAPLRDGGLSAPTVQVFIGERELTDIVDVQIGQADARSLDYVRSGRRL